MYWTSRNSKQMAATSQLHIQWMNGQQLSCSLHGTHGTAEGI